MLFLVGTGLSEKDLSLRAIEVCKECKIYAESYTSFLTEEGIDAISKIINKPIKILGRSDFEENSKKLIAEAANGNVAVLVPGDPLIATTHKILYIEAAKQGLKPIVVHSSSIFSSAIGESGLDFYRFGRVCTIPKWSEHYKPVSFYETIKTNQDNNQHTLLLLDYDPAKESSISPKEAIETLEEAEGHYKKKIITNSVKIFVLHNISIKGESKTFTNIENVKRIMLDRGPTVFILPAEITEIEKESIESMFR